MDGIDDSVAMVEDLDTALSQPLGNAYADVIRDVECLRIACIDSRISGRPRGRAGGDGGAANEGGNAGDTRCSHFCHRFQSSSALL